MNEQDKLQICLAWSTEKLKIIQSMKTCDKSKKPVRKNIIRSQVVEKQCVDSYNFKTFRASLKTFPGHHLAKAKLEITSVPYIILYV